MNITGLLKKIFLGKTERNAYVEGYIAAEDLFTGPVRNRQPSCPYRPNTEEYDDWMEGVDDASSECCLYGDTASAAR